MGDKKYLSPAQLAVKVRIEFIKKDDGNLSTEGHVTNLVKSRNQIMGGAELGQVEVQLLDSSRGNAFRHFGHAK